MYNIRFGTDGWRAIIAKDFTVENVNRVAEASCKWLKQRGFHKVVIGHDCRFGGQMFLEEIACTFANEGIQCLIARGFVSTPMVSLGVLQNAAHLGVVITASHNPASYNGYKLKSSLGGPLLPKGIAEIEALIPAEAKLREMDFESCLKNGLIEYIDLEAAYIHHVQSHFDLQKIRTNVSLAYDAMYGAGQNVMKQIYPEMVPFHCHYNPGFENLPPEPIERNLQEIMKFLAKHPGQFIGVANDGDADRLAFIDSKGNMVDSHHVLLLLLYYLVVYKKQTGAVVVSFSVTNKLKKLADHFGLECIITKIGFKYIAEYMTTKEVLVGGEESGGLAIKGHIPERDGIWIALTLLQYIAETGKTLEELIDEVYQIVGPFYYDRWDLSLSEYQINLVKESLHNGISEWGNQKVLIEENLDGYKYHFQNDRWLLIRTSGTEPVLRIYAQAENKQEVLNLLNQARAVLKV
ncbi:MAG: phosphoglucomutase/phosphomannomutase family protein [Saprospiraceae bacterium]|nr:phosphoglucomutase/phosphomannomutase family protein [Saprospiraceae bacterium]